MAQIPKIPKVPKVNIGKGGKKDEGKTTTASGKKIDNTADNRKAYKDMMDKGYALKASYKYLEAVPFFENAEKIAPYSPTETLDRDARNQAASCKEKDEKCKAQHIKMSDLLSQKKYKEAYNESADFCEVAPASGTGCKCLLPQAEIDKVVTAYKSSVAAEEKAVKDAENAKQEQELAKKYAPIPDNGVVGSLHKSHVNKIVFSKTPITVNSPESALTNSFNLGDDIYFRVFLDKSPANTKRAARTSTDLHFTTIIEIYVNDVNIYPDRKYTGYDLKGLPSEPFSSEKSTTALEALSHKWGPMEGDRDANAFLTQFYKATYNLPAGAHKVKLVYKETGIAAEFSLNVTEAGKLTLGKKICAIPIIKEQYKDYNKSLRIVPNAASLIKYDGSTLIKVVEVENDWTYRKNNYGIITRRVISGVAYFKDNKNGLYHAEPVQFVQENISSGGSKYGTTVGTVVGDPRLGGYRFCKECLGK
jgi:hypothetical protein